MEERWLRSISAEDLRRCFIRVQLRCAISDERTHPFASNLLMPSPLSDSRQIGAREHYRENAVTDVLWFILQWNILYYTAAGIARATDITKRSRSLRRDETPIIRAGIRVKIIERERTRRVRERMRHGGWNMDKGTSGEHRMWTGRIKEAVASSGGKPSK